MNNISDCTIKTEKQAQVAAEKLAKVMGEGWTPRVHENIGWHYSVEWGNLITIYPWRLKVTDRVSYFCLLSDKERVGAGRGGSSLWSNTDGVSYYCPKECVAATLKRANMVVENLNKVLEKANKCLNK